MSVVENEKFDILLQTSGKEFSTCIYSKDFKKKRLIATINEDKDRTMVCVFAYDCQLKDLNIKTSTEYCNDNK